MHTRCAIPLLGKNKSVRVAVLPLQDFYRRILYIFNIPGSFARVHCIIQSVIPLNDTTPAPYWNHRVRRNITLVRLQLSDEDKPIGRWTKTWDSFRETRDRG